MKPIKYVALFILSIMLIGSGVIFYYYHYSAIKLQTYFNYTQPDLNELRALESEQEITHASLYKWDAIMFNLVKRNKLGDTAASKVYAYVYVAQRDAAFISNNVKNKFIGSIEPISAEVMCLFFPYSCSSLKLQISNPDDLYSNILAKVVIKKLSERINQDKKQTYLYPEKKNPKAYWMGVRPYYGQDVGSWKTWLLKSGREFFAPPPFPPESAQWKNEVKIVKDSLNNTPEQITSVVFWAGNPSTITPPGIWLVYANDYMKLHDVNLTNELNIRSVLAMGIADSVITVFNSKYTYYSKRPFMRDPSIHTIMPTPNHPSYPAAHSTLSAAAAVILSYYFPENKNEWRKYANQASQGRVWGGIHFELDTKQGMILGDKVGNAVIRKVHSPIDNK